MKYTNYDMNAYNLHIINTNKFKTITIEVDFRYSVNAKNITKTNVLKDMLLSSSYNYPSEIELVKETENLYDLKLSLSNIRIGNDNVLSFRTRFLNEIYTENKMNEESIKFLLDVIFNPNVKNGKFNDEDLKKSKNRLAKNIHSIKDNKLKYALFNLFSKYPDKPYSYNPYGYIEELDEIDSENLYTYYKDIINNSIIDIFVVGDVDGDKIKNIFKENFKAYMFHPKRVDILVKELEPAKRIKKYKDIEDANQSQFTMLCSLNGLTDFERKYVLLVYNEMLGGSSNSILFDTVRGKNSYAYYVNSSHKAYDNILFIYAGVEPGNDEAVLKLVRKSLVDISKGKFNDELLEASKKAIISGITTSFDYPVGIINNYLAKVLVNSEDAEVRIRNIEKITRDDIIFLAKKVRPNAVYVLEGQHEGD